jgi:hypothetical protein
MRGKHSRLRQALSGPFPDRSLSAKANGNKPIMIRMTSRSPGRLPGSGLHRAGRAFLLVAAVLLLAGCEGHNSDNIFFEMIRFLFSF